MVAQRAFEFGQETLTLCIAVAIAGRFHGRAQANFIAAQVENHGFMLRPRGAMTDDIVGCRYVRRIDDKRFLVVAPGPANDPAVEGSQDLGQMQKARPDRHCT